jgi:hypothetical protein
MQQPGFFTLSLQFIRSVIPLIKDLLSLASRFQGGLLSQLLLLAFVWIVVVPLINVCLKCIKGFIWLMRKFE